METIESENLSKPLIIILIDDQIVTASIIEDSRIDKINPIITKLKGYQWASDLPNPKLSTMFTIFV